MNPVLISKIIGVSLLSIGLIISSFKKKVLLSIGILVIGIAFLILMNNLE